MLQQKKKDIIRFMIDDIEGGHADLEGDRGGKTVYGISSRWFPAEYQKVVSGEWDLDDVVQFYADQFADRLARFDDLLVLDARFAALLLFGKVHGTGLRDYTLLIQQGLVDQGASIRIDGLWGPTTADTLLAASSNERDEIFSLIASNRSSLVDARTASVGGYRKGMQNRITKVLRYAASLVPQQEEPSNPGVTPDRGVSQWVEVNHAGANFSVKIG